MSVKVVLLATFVFFLVSIPTAVPATEWFVDASVAESGDGRTPETAFKRIQEGIDAAGDGERVSVSAGDYAERLLIRKILSLSGSGADVTTIDAGGGRCTLLFTGPRYEELDTKKPPPEKPQFSMEGFTVTNSSTDAGTSSLSRRRIQTRVGGSSSSTAPCGHTLTVAPNPRMSLGMRMHEGTSTFARRLVRWEGNAD